MKRLSEQEALDSFAVVPYCANWVEWYEEEQAALLERVRSGFLEVEHIGSTSVPDLDAKPIIDLMAAVARLDQCESVVRSLKEYGYILIETGMRNRLFFRRRSADGRTFHLHLVAASTWDSRKERILRDYLRVHRDAAAAYGRLKRVLAQECADDSLSYTRRKTDFIQSVMDRAFAERGLPAINVWED